VAVTVDVNLPLKELRLKDGLLFTDVAVRSFNTATGTVMLLANSGQIAGIDLDQRLAGCDHGWEQGGRP
jgi:hypothetical protein